MALNPNKVALDVPPTVIPFTIKSEVKVFAPPIVWVVDKSTKFPTSAIEAQSKAPLPLVCNT